MRDEKHLTSPSTELTLSTALRQLRRTLRNEVLPILGRLPAYGRLIYSLAAQAGLSGREKTPLFLALGYQLSPVDLIPGFIPVIGQLDDLLVMFWGIRRTLDAVDAARADALFAAAGLTRVQMDADAEIIRRSLHELLAGSARSAGRGTMSVLKAGVSAMVYIGCLAYYVAKGRKRK